MKFLRKLKTWYLQFIAEIEFVKQNIDAHNFRKLWDEDTYREKVIIPIFKRMGIFQPTIKSQLLIDLETYFTLGEEEFKGLPTISRSGLHLDTDLVIKEWMEENLLQPEDTVQLCIQRRYTSKGDVSRNQYDRIDGRMILHQFGFLVRYQEQNLYVYCYRPLTSPLRWSIEVHGDSGNEFLEALETRINAWLVKKYRGKYLDMRLNVIPIKPYSLDELVFPQHARERIADLIKIFDNWHMGNSIPRWGCLLIGPRGTGKTTIGGLLANRRRECDTEPCTVLYSPAAEISSDADIKAIFYRAHMFEPAIIIIDDIDLIAGDRRDITASNSLTAALMENLDGLRENGKFFIILTTNDPSKMEKAIITRAGRIFDKLVLANYRSCMPELLTLYAKKYVLSLAEDVIKKTSEQFLKDHDEKSFTGFTPDEIKNIAQRLTLLCGNEEINVAQLKKVLHIVYDAFYNAENDQACL